jgi:hypothetical protein
MVVGPKMMPMLMLVAITQGWEQPDECIWEDNLNM